MQLIDSHCHFDFDPFSQQRQQILQSCQQRHINQIIIPAVTQQRWSTIAKLCQSSNMLHPAYGLHPMFMAEHDASDFDALVQQVTSQHCVAIGEIGLDFYHASADKTAQQRLFIEQLTIAQQTELPIIIHVRKAHDLVIQLLKQYPVVGGVIHAFNGSLQQAQQYQSLSFALGVGGVITHPKATRMAKLVKALPLSNILLETDAPDMPLFNQPQPYNSPENISLIVAALAKLREQDPQQIAAVTTANCFRTFPQLTTANTLANAH